MRGIESVGGRIILMASRALAACASADDYERVYDRVLSQVSEPVILHWLGDMFDPALAGYWGTRRPRPRRWTSASRRHRARNAAKVDGIKISLLDKDAGDRHAPSPPEDVRMYTGDDFNYAELIAGDEHGYSRRAARHLRRDRAGGSRGAGGAGAAATSRSSTRSWRRRCRCRATSSGRRRASTRRAWSSWPSSTAIRTISPWSAARRARARCCTSPSCSGWPTRPACFAIPSSRRRA